MFVFCSLWQGCWGPCSGRTPSPAWCEGHACASRADGAVPDLMTPCQTWSAVALCLQVTPVSLSWVVGWPETSEVGGSFHTYLIWISDQLAMLGLNCCVLVVSSTSRSGLQPLCTPNAAHTTAAAVSPLEKAHA